MGETFLVLGATGMLGRALMAEGRRRGLHIVGAARMNADYAVDIKNAESLTRLLEKIRPSTVINSAAIIDFDACERDPGLAYLVNARPASIITKYIKGNDCRFVQISTDNYYKGDRDLKHAESHPVTLVSEYARTKYAAEAFARTSRNSLIIRTNFTGPSSRGRKSFFDWSIESIKSKETIDLFSDYYVSTIDVRFLSRAIHDLTSTDARGIVNIASRDVFSKKDFVTNLANIRGETIDYKNATVAALPHRCESLGLSVARVEKLLSYRMPDLASVIQNLLKEYQK